MEEKLLLLEDDRGLVDGLVYALGREGFLVEVATRVSEAKEMLGVARYDMLILDVSLPDGSGFAVCEAVRRAGSRVPILFLTARDEEVNVIRGLDGGGDDYLTKPFRLGELCSRIRALLRRAQVQADSEVISGDVRLDVAAACARRGEETLALTGTEVRLLLMFLRHPGQILTRTQLLQTLWDAQGDFVDDNTLSVYIRRLREKLEEDPSHPKRLVTVRGLGYLWKEEGR